jgi:hypothetical protein
MGLSAALGANLWIVAVAVPLILGGSSGAHAVPGGVAGVIVLVTLAPAILTWGLARRSERALLGAFPVAALLPQAWLSMPELRVLPPVPFVLLAASLVGYLLASARFVAAPVEAVEPIEEAGASARPAISERRLAQPPTPPRWRRRLRVYRALAACAVIIPASLIGYAHFGPSGARLAEAFAGRVESAQVLVTVGIGLLTIILYRAYLLAPLEAHLQHDRDLARYTEAARRQARKGRPRTAFYFAVAVALAAMIAIVLQRAGSFTGRP